MAVNFPHSPSSGDVHSEGGASWRYNGYAWARIPDPGAKGEPGIKGQKGEVGLTGEIRPVNRIEQRISEANKLGFEKIYISKYNTKGLDESKYKLKIEKVARVEELFRSLFKKN